MSGRRLICKSCLVQGTVEPIPAFITREHAPRSIASMGCRRQSNKKHARARIAKAGIWLSPILLVGKPLHFLACNLLTPANKARTAAAGNDLLLKSLKSVHVQRDEITSWGHSTTGAESEPRREHMGQHGAPRGPVMWNIVSPQIEMMRNPLAGEHLSKVNGSLGGFILPLS